MHFVAFWSRCKILGCKIRACTESKISSKFLGLKVTQQFCLLLSTFSPSLFFCFSCSFFFFCRAFSRLHFGGKSFQFKILGLDERKGRWLVEQDFHGIFRSMLHCFLAFSRVSLTCSFCYGLKDLFTLDKLADKVVLDHSNSWCQKQ